jgi:hemerythrin-like metal-binding protein
MIFEWTEKYSVNVKEIDDQHKAFIGIINKLYDSINGGKDAKELDEIFRELVEYAHFHFKTEEKYFDKFDYPDTQKHKEAHKELFRKIEALMAKKTVDKVSLSYELLDFLEDWLVDHLNVMDKDYGAFFKAHELV